MTRKDYELLAREIHHAHKGAWQFATEKEQRIAHSTMRVFVQNIAKQLEKDNPRFSFEKFWEACGL